MSHLFAERGLWGHPEVRPIASVKVLNAYAHPDASPERFYRALAASYARLIRRRPVESCFLMTARRRQPLSNEPRLSLTVPITLGDMHIGDVWDQMAAEGYGRLSPDDFDVHARTAIDIAPSAALPYKFHPTDRMAYEALPPAPEYDWLRLLKDECDGLRLLIN